MAPASEYRVKLNAAFPSFIHRLSKLSMLRRWYCWRKCLFTANWTFGRSQIVGLDRGTISESA
jgi:hypothetical protein